MTTFAQLIERLRGMGINDDDEIESITLDFGVPGAIEMDRGDDGRVSIWHEYD